MARGRFKVCNKYLKVRGSVYWFVRRVPSDVRGEYGRGDVVERSLRTPDVHLARQSRDKCNAQLEQAWQKIRDRRGYVDPMTGHPLRAPLGEPSEQGLLRAYREGQRWPWVEGRDVWSVVDWFEDELMDLALLHATRHGLACLDEAQEAVEGTRKGKELRAKIGAAKGEIPFMVAAKEFLAQASLAQNTKEAYQTSYRALRGLPSPPLVTREEARKALQRLAPRSAKGTLNGHRYALRALWGHLGLDPGIWSGFRLDAGRKGLVREAWTDQEVRALLANARGIVHDALLIGAYTGMRIGEVCGGMSYDGGRDAIVVTRAKTEAGRREIPCPKAIREVAREWRGMDGGYLSKCLNRLKGDLGMPRGTKSFHSFRHSVASKLNALGCPEHLAALILGHRHKALTYGWYGRKIDVEVLRGWIDKINFE